MQLFRNGFCISWLLAGFVLLLVACPAQSQTPLTDSLQHQGRLRRYSLNVPPGYSANTPAPLVLTLHGGGGSIQSVQPFTQMNRVSNDFGFLAAYPEGYTENNNGHVWADGRGTQADADGIDDVGFIDKLIDSLKAAYNIDTTRIYVCGFSNGGFMTQRLACELTNTWAAAGGLGCSMDINLYDTCSPASPLPMLYVLGTADPFVPFEGGTMNPGVDPIVAIDSAVQFWVARNGCKTAEPVVNLPDSTMDDSSTVKRWDYTDCDCDADVRFYQVDSGGHTWPGVAIPQQEALLGETNEDMHASYALWDFFQHHQRCTQPIIDSRLEASALRLQVYPNPADRVLRIQSSARLAELQLCDAQGRRVRQRALAAKRAELAIAALGPGLYSLQLRFRDGRQRTRKLLIQ
jgi:polyhydroxybutyrate depolymerase